MEHTSKHLLAKLVGGSQKPFIPHVILTEDIKGVVKPGSQLQPTQFQTDPLSLHKSEQRSGLSSLNKSRNVSNSSNFSYDGDSNDEGLFNLNEEIAKMDIREKPRIKKSDLDYEPKIFDIFDSSSSHEKYQNCETSRSLASKPKREEIKRNSSNRSRNKIISVKPSDLLRTHKRHSPSDHISREKLDIYSLKPYPEKKEISRPRLNSNSKGKVNSMKPISNSLLGQTGFVPGSSKLLRKITNPKM